MANRINNGLSQARNQRWGAFFQMIYRQQLQQRQHKFSIRLLSHWKSANVQRAHFRSHNFFRFSCGLFQKDESESAAVSWRNFVQWAFFTAIHPQPHLTVCAVDSEKHDLWKIAKVVEASILLLESKTTASLRPFILACKLYACKLSCAWQWLTEKSVTDCGCSSYLQIIIVMYEQKVCNECCTTAVQRMQLASFPVSLSDKFEKSASS